MIEIWKQIPGYEGLYAVSSYGRVKSLKWGKQRILKPGIHSRGYLQVLLCKDGKCKMFTIHRLVAEAFIPNPNNLPQVCHKDDNKTNNSVDNLFWGTVKDNQDDSHHKGRHTKPKRAVTNGVQIFESTIEAKRQTGVHQGDIVACCRGRLKTAGGLIWKYSV